MKKYLILLLILLSIGTSIAQQFPTFDWARVASEGFPNIPSVGTSYGSSIRLIKRDAAGNIYVSGDLNKAMTFANTNIYGQNFSSERNSYLMKLNPTGESILWVKTTQNGQFKEFFIADDGFIYVNGQRNVDTDGVLKYGAATIAGGTAYSEIRGPDAFFMKINATDGNLLWVKNATYNPSIVVTSYYDNYPEILVDNTAIYTSDGLGPNSSNTTTQRGYRIIKILKTAADTDPDYFIDNKAWVLDRAWFRTNVDPNFENFVLDMKFSPNKQSICLYLKTGNAWIDDFSGQFYDTREMIVVRLDNLNNASPTVGFMKKFTTIICPDEGQLEIDTQGNVILTGTFGISSNRYTLNGNGNGVVSFAGQNYEFPVGTQKQFIAKLSSAGVEQWIKFYDVQQPYMFRSLTTDNADNMYVCQGGYPSMTTIGSFTSMNDPFWVMKLKPDGEQVYMWSNEEGNSGGDPVICANNSTDILVGTNGGGGKYGTKEIARYSGFVLSNLKHSGVTKPFEEFRKLKDINTGSNVQYGLFSSNPNRFTELGGGLVFFAWTNPSLTVKEAHLFKTNGTEIGTTPLTNVSFHSNYDFEGAGGNSVPLSNISVKTPTHLYFEGSSKNASNNRQSELWKSDGTVAGTVKFKSFDTGQIDYQSSFIGLHPYDIQNMVFNNGLVFFTMTDATNSKVDLWKTDGTEAGTVRLFEGCVPELAVYNNYVYYFINGVADQFGNIPYTLRRHNGTSGGFVKNLATTSSNATNIPRFFGVVNNQLLFTADGSIVLNSNNVNSGMELWKTDGTGAGTVIVKDINPETPNNFPPGPFASGKSSITYGTQEKNNIKISALSQRFIIYNNTLYFGADDGINGRELWKSDGTETGTVMVANFTPGTYTDIWGTTFQRNTDPVQFFLFQNKLVFGGYNYDTNLSDLYYSDGTVNGTSILKNSFSSHGFTNFAVLNNNLYFSAFDQPNSLIHPTYNEPLTSGYELWVSDGTPQGTKQLKNMAKGWLYAPPIHLTSWNGSLYYTYYNVVNPYSQVPLTEAEPWKFTPAACTTPAPAGPLATEPTILASYPATIKANGCLGIVKWYAGASGGSPIFIGDNYTTPLLNTTTTYYLSCTFNNCESQRSPATVTVNQPVCTTLPAVPTSSGGSVVSGNSITLSAIGCTEQTRWYGQASGGAILAQTPTFTTPVLTIPTTYYPVCFVLGCESPRTVLNNITITPSSGQALDFDGTDDVVTVPANNGFNSQNFTIEAWVKFDANNKSQTIMDNSQRWMYYQYNPNAIKFGFADNGNPREVGFSFTPTAESWYHLACSFNNTSKEAAFFINGELQDIQNINFAPSQSNFGMKIGNHYTNSNWQLDGRIEEARYWNVVRTETQIGANYNTELSGNESGLVFYYKFDGEATCDVQDCSPNQLHGTRIGATGINNKPQFVNTSVALIDVACGVSSSCTLLNPCLSSLLISSPNYSTETIISQASATNGLLTATNQISSTARVTYQSKVIILNQGFVANPNNGGVFKAEIGGCN